MEQDHKAEIFLTRLAQLGEQLTRDSERIEGELREIALLVKQTHAEIERLAERETSVSTRLHEVELNLENYARSDLRAMYMAQQEAQMRHFMMRGQAEQLTAKERSLRAQRDLVGEVLAVIAERPGLLPAAPAPPEPAPGPGGADSIADVIQAQEEERLHIARQMHDGPAQAMTNLVLKAEICERLLDFDASKVKVELSGLKSMVNATLQETRQFIFDLRPMILDDLGLFPTLRRYLKGLGERAKMEVGLSTSGREERLPAHLEVALFRLVQEALTNASAMGKASKAQVAIHVGDDRVSVTLEDDGAPRGSPAARNALASMKRRVEVMHGSFQADIYPRGGTRLIASLPRRPAVRTRAATGPLAGAPRLAGD